MKPNKYEKIKKIKDCWGHYVEMVEFKSNGQELMHWSDGIKTIYPFRRTHFFNLMCVSINFIKSIWWFVKLIVLAGMIYIGYYAIYSWNYIKF